MRYVLLATLLLLASCSPQPPKTRDEVEPFITLTDKTVGLMQKISIGAPEADVLKALQELLDASRAAEPKVNAAMNRIGESSRTRTLGDAQARACLEGRTHGAPASGTRLANWRPAKIEESDFRPSWVSFTTDCVGVAQAFLTSLSDVRAADDVGFAVGVLHSLILAVDADMAMDESLPASVYRAQLESYRVTNVFIMRKLAPRCHEWTTRKPEHVTEVHYECRAYDGQSAQGFEVYQQDKLASVPLDRTAISAQAGRFTSYGLAAVAQPKLDALIRALDEREKKG